jgi:integrase
MAVPRDLTARFQLRELKVSLKTTDRSKARLRCRALSVAALQLIATVRAMPELTAERVQDITRRYFQQVLDRTEELAFLTPPDAKVDQNHEIALAEEETQAMRMQLASRAFSSITISEANTLLAAEVLSATGEDFDLLCATVLRARIEGRRIYGAKLAGRYDLAAPIDPLFAGMQSLGLPSTDAQPFSEAKHRLAEVAERYLELKRKEWVHKTYLENRRVLELFMEIVGATRLMKSINDDDIREFRDILLKLPANFTKSKQNVGLGAKEIAQKAAGIHPLQKKTIWKYRANLTTFLNWCVDEGYLEKSPGAKIKVAGVSAKEAQEAREAYSKDQLVQLFSSPVYTGCFSEARRSKPGKLILRDGKFWIPLVALFTGMRLGEIVQLLVSDIKDQDGVAYFDLKIGEGENKSLKTASSTRKVPIHEELIRIGFLAYVEKRRSMDLKGRLFPDVAVGKDGYHSHNFSKWWGRYTRELGIKAGRTAFHSFRHSFKDALVSAQVPANSARSLMGHAAESVHDLYGSKIPLSVLNPHLQKIAYPVDLSTLYEKHVSCATS